MAASLPNGAKPAEDQRRAATPPGYSEPQTAWKLVPSDVRGGAQLRPVTYIQLAKGGHTLSVRTIGASWVHTPGPKCALILLYEEALRWPSTAFVILRCQLYFIWAWPA